MAELGTAEREERRARLVKELLELGMDEEDAQFAVSLHLGETHGDVMIEGPMTAEDYRAVGLDRDFLFGRDRRPAGDRG